MRSLPDVKVAVVDKDAYYLRLELPATFPSGSIDDVEFQLRYASRKQTYKYLSAFAVCLNIPQVWLLLQWIILCVLTNFRSWHVHKVTAHIRMFYFESVKIACASSNPEKCSVTYRQIVPHSMNHM